MGTNPVTNKPIAPFILSLMAGLLVFGGSGMMSFSLGAPYYGMMMGGNYGMMEGYYGAMMQGFGLGGMFYAMVAIGVVSGIAILLSAIMLFTQPSRAPTWGTLILAFSIVSFLGMGGFFMGAILGIVGGVLGLAWKTPQGS